MIQPDMAGLRGDCQKYHDNPEMPMRYLDGIKMSGEELISLLDSVLHESCCRGSETCCDFPTLDSMQLEKYLQAHLETGAGQQFSILCTYNLYKRERIMFSLVQA